MLVELGGSVSAEMSGDWGVVVVRLSAGKVGQFGVKLTPLQAAQFGVGLACVVRSMQIKGLRPCRLPSLA